MIEVSKDSPIIIELFLFWLKSEFWNYIFLETIICLDPELMITCLKDMKLYHHLQSPFYPTHYLEKLDMDKFLESQMDEGLARVLDDKEWRATSQTQARAWVWFSLGRVEHLEELNVFHKSLTASLLNVKKDSLFVSKMQPDLKEKLQAFDENHHFRNKLEGK